MKERRKSTSDVLWLTGYYNKPDMIGIVRHNTNILVRFGLDRSNAMKTAWKILKYYGKLNFGER